MSAIVDINGNTLRTGRAAEAWRNRNKHKATRAVVDGADKPLLMIEHENGHTYRRRCKSLDNARIIASRQGLYLDTSVRGTDYDESGRVLTLDR